MEQIDSKVIELEEDMIEKRRKICTFLKTDNNRKYLNLVIPITPELNINEEINLIGKETTLEHREAVLRNEYINHLCKDIPKIDADIDIVIDKVLEEIKSLPIETETSISGLLATLYSCIPRHGGGMMFVEFDLSTNDLFEIYKKVLEKAEVEGINLDFSKYEGQMVGLPFNIPFIKR